MIQIRSAKIKMNNLCNEIFSRFPEIKPLCSSGDEELTYLLMGYVVEWLNSIGKSGFSKDVIQRVISFSKWCEEQPRTKSASDDIWTIFMVGFYENLFQEKYTKILIPKVMPKADVVANKDYLINWLGKDEYESVLKEYK